MPRGLGVEPGLGTLDPAACPGLPLEAWEFWECPDMGEEGLEPLGGTLRVENVDTCRQLMFSLQLPTAFTVEMLSFALI